MNGKFYGLLTRLIPGKTELLPGDESIGKLDIVSRPINSTVNYGMRSQWVKLPRNERKKLVIPLVPEGKDKEVGEFLKRTGKLTPKGKETAVSNCCTNKAQESTKKIDEQAKRAKTGAKSSEAQGPKKRKSKRVSAWTKE